MRAANNTRAAFYAVVNPYLEKIYENAPNFGSAGLTLIFHEGMITRVDVMETVQRRVTPPTGGTK